MLILSIKFYYFTISEGKKKFAEGHDNNNLLLFYDDFSVIIKCSVE